MSAFVEVGFNGLSESARMALTEVAKGEPVWWAGKVVRGRLRNLGLIVEDTAGYDVTELGATVATILAEHRLTTSRRPLGRGAVAGSGMRYGINGKCSCREWEGYSNEAATAGGDRDVRSYHARHLDEALAKVDRRPEPPTVAVTVVHELTREGLTELLCGWYVDVGYQSLDPLSGQETWEAVAFQLREVGLPDPFWSDSAGLNQAEHTRIWDWAAAQVAAGWPELGRRERAS